MLDKAAVDSRLPPDCLTSEETVAFPGIVGPALEPTRQLFLYIRNKIVFQNFSICYVYFMYSCIPNDVRLYLQHLLASIVANDLH